MLTSARLNSPCQGRDGRLARLPQRGRLDGVPGVFTILCTPSKVVATSEIGMYVPGAFFAAESKPGPINVGARRLSSPAGRRRFVLRSPGVDAGQARAAA